MVEGEGCKLTESDFLEKYMADSTLGEIAQTDQWFNRKWKCVRSIIME